MHGSIFISENGELFKSFNAKDGLAIELLRTHNIKTGVISGKSSKALAKRCKDLAFDYIETGCKNKLPRVKKICDILNINLSEVAFVGDDVIDLPVIDLCGVSFAPSDAHQLVLERVQNVTSAAGGQGVVREVADKLLLSRSKNLEDVYKVFLDKILNDEMKTMEQ